MTTLLLLFWEFFKIGLFAIGGGLATLPFLIDLTNTYPEWLTMTDISNMVAISESTPGPMGINMATYVGNHVGQAIFGNIAGGALGGFIATLGEVTPSIIIILIVARILSAFKDNKYVRRAFYGLRATVIALIAYAAWNVYTLVLFDGASLKWVEIIIFLAMTVLILKFKKVHPIVWILIAAAAGLVLG